LVDDLYETDRGCGCCEPNRSDVEKEIIDILGRHQIFKLEVVGE
jgi:hypothetical protein